MADTQRNLQADVVFDFEGSLRLARRLWRLADEVTLAAGRRIEAREAAQAAWRGPHAEHFATVRAPNEDASTANVVAALRQEAVGWGVMWAAALNDQNRINWARAVEQEKDHRSTTERFGDFFVGDDSAGQVPEPPPYPAPRPPTFVPTGSLVHYSNDGGHWVRHHSTIEV